MTDERRDTGWDEGDGATLLEILDASVSAPGSGPASAECREGAELLGLLAYDAAAPSAPAELRSRILAAAGGREARSPVTSPVSSRVGSAPERSPLGGWTGLLAAGLAVATLGLGLFSYSLSGRIAEHEARLAEQAERIAELVSEGARVERELASARDELAAAQTRFAIVTGARTEICELAPPERDGPVPGARGTLFVAADHQHWYLKAYGLEAPERGVYQLWFVPRGGDPVSAGTFTVIEGATELSSTTMPANTSAIAITLEAEPAERPSGPVVLYGDEVMLIL